MYPIKLSFCSDELCRALTEQSFGIKTFSITTSTQHRASASVTLLEGKIITITLTTTGYSVDYTNGGPAISIDLQCKQEYETFETIEDALRSVSTLYERKRQELLVQKLEKLSKDCYSDMYLN